MLPVAILDPRERAVREGLIEDLTHRPHRVDVTLMLDDGAPATACVDPDELLWLGLRRGDIVGVRPLPVPAPCEAPADLLSV